MRFLKNYKLVLLLAAVVFVLLCRPVFYDMYGKGSYGDDVYMEIEQGEALSSIASKLKDKGIIECERAFYYYSKKKSEKFQYGGHIFNSGMSYREICDSLSEYGAAKGVRISIPEGYEIRLMAEAFEAAGLVSAEEFIKCADNDSFDYDFIKDVKGTVHRLEGFLFPDTYEFLPDATAHEIIDTMLGEFDRVYNDEYKKRAKELGMSVYDVVTLASVIEREAADESEHKRVSGVFINRIKDKMKLQSCATVQYILKERKPVLSLSDTKINSPYNTYENAGLPIGPIASPGKSAIEAALYPERHDYYYFVARADGNGHIFSKTFDEHERAVNREVK